MRDAAPSVVPEGAVARIGETVSHERACAEREPNLPYIGCMPIFDPLRAEPRFQALLRRMNLPQ